MEGEEKKKQHRKRQSGSKFDKKKSKEKKKAGSDGFKHNPKAFTFSGGVNSVHRSVQRTLDKQSKREKQEKIDKTPDIPPPVIIVVQGPPGVGKSTLVQSLVKHYTKQTVTSVRGTITLTSGRNRRLTIVECSNDIHEMIDLAKIADLVLVMIDASFGFEMETFEFINIMQTHGFPRVLGVLTHLDSFKDSKLLKNVKKRLKDRFWTEIYDGAKLFYLTALQNKKYLKVEVKNLARFISVQNLSHLSWRETHPYFLSLRYEIQNDTHTHTHTHH
eukprot:GHVR01058529.1.p1 GENE.GHVR01058529.1~~GHVR01058529.1.p1  ORF type:complete len:274 (-),score=75.05 GHVR01058529.1:297-1118(-)